MLVLKMMSDEDKGDSNTSKGFKLICCDNVEFYRNEGNQPIAKVEINDGSVDYFLDGNAYVMQNGKTIASYAYSNYEDHFEE